MKCNSWNKASELQKLSFITIYSTCISTHLDYADGVDEETYKSSLTKISMQ